MVSFLFFCFAGVAILSSLGVILFRNPVYSVLSLILTFFVASALFILLGAELVAMLLVIVYVGAVAVLFLFVVMMLDFNQVRSGHGLVKWYPVGVLCAMLFFGCAAYAALQARVASAGAGGDGVNVENIFLIGSQLYTEYVYAFQLSGVLLLVAAVGSLVLAMRDKRRPAESDFSRYVNRSSKVTLLSPEVGQGVEDVD
ncbi:MAG: NADH-quinone oxidoreductase subunit J [Anaplasma sp.]